MATLLAPSARNDQVDVLAQRRAAADRARQWRQDNPEKWARSRKAYGQRHPEVARAASRRWRACKRAERLLDQLRVLWAEHGNRLTFLGERLEQLVDAPAALVM